jgi:hypothetical protein
MPFVSIFEQVILEQKQQILSQAERIRAYKQKIVTLEQLILDREQQAHVSCLDGIALGLKLKFREEGQALFAEVQKRIDLDLDWLIRFLNSIELVDSLDDLRKLLP